MFKPIAPTTAIRIRLSTDNVYSSQMAGAMPMNSTANAATAQRVLGIGIIAMSAA